MARLGNPYLKNLDSHEIESRYSNEQGINYKEIRSSNVSFERDIMPYIKKLPVREQDLLELYFETGKNQKDIAKMFSVTQGAISSRITRAIKRLQFLRDLPKIPERDLDDILGKIFENIEVEIIKLMIETTCQSKTADIINAKYNFKDKKRMTQVKVRHRFEKCLKHLSELKSSKPEMARYHDLLDFIKKHLYMLHEVRLPHFDRGGFHLFSIN